MKKIFMLLAAVLVSMTAWADAEVKDGNLAPLKNADARVLITWDYSKMTIEDKAPAEFLKEKGPDWGEGLSRRGFCRRSRFRRAFQQERQEICPDHR